MLLIRRQDVTTTDGITPENGIYITVTLEGVLATLYNDDESAKANPFTVAGDGSFSYNVAVAGTYVEEYRTDPLAPPKTVVAVALGFATDAVSIYVSQQATAAAIASAAAIAAAEDATLAVAAAGLLGSLASNRGAGLQFVSVSGQSLAQNHSGGMNETLTQEFASVAFPHLKTTTTYTDLVPAVATDLSIIGGTIPRLDGESPLNGLLGYGYEASRAVADIDFLPRIGINNGLGATAIASHVKGQASYNSILSALTAAKNYATSLGSPVFYGGDAWYQGESDSASTAAAYKATLQRRARDLADDGKAITGQAQDPATFTYITDSNPVNTGTRSGVARAQHQAAIDFYQSVVPSGHTVPAPVILSTPTYFMARLFDVTGLHVGADWAYMLGAYAALAEYKAYVEPNGLPLNQRWPPIHPIAVTWAGGVATLTFKLRAPGTVLAFGVASILNGDGIPLQTNYGFGVYDGSTLRSLSSVAIIGANQVQITLASGSFASGWRIGYALDYPPVHNFYATQAGGSTGNLRDNYGDTVRCARMNLPMHNWVAPFDVTLGAGTSWSLS